MAIREVWIKCTDKEEVEVHNVAFAKDRLFELIHSGYGVSASVTDEEGLTLYVTLTRF